MKEKRQKRRQHIHLDILASNPPISQGSSITNMSITGAFISSLQTLPVASQIAIDIQLPHDRETMTINARIIWTEPVSFPASGGMGIEFIDIPEEQHKKLAAFIKQNA